MKERVQKIMAAAGISSRRAAEEMILEGRVRVNGAVVTELGTKADPEQDHIKVDGKLINPQQPKTYVMLNKPVGYVTTMSDPEGRPVVSDLLQGVRARVYPVGRLDYNTEGLLLLTNDGDFAHLVTHPRHELPKTYLVKVKGVLDDREVDNLEKGVFLKDGKTAPAKVRKLRKEEANSWVEITIHEGRKRQVRRMIDHTGHSVIKLKRVRVGNLNLGDLPLGGYRHLTAEEVKGLQEASLREQGPAITKPKAESRPPRMIGGSDRPRISEQKGREILTGRDQSDFDAWSSEAVKRRRRERDERSRTIRPRRYGKEESPSWSMNRKMDTREQSGGRLSRGPKPDRERSASAPSWGRKPDLREQGSGRFSRGPKPDRARSSSAPSWGRKPDLREQGAGRFSRGPKPYRERSASAPSWGRKPDSREQGAGRFSRGPKPDRERSASAPSWGRRPDSREQGAGRFSRGPKPDRERSSSAPSWGRKTGPRPQGAGGFSRSKGPKGGGAGPRGPRGATARKQRGR
jgi:23S rRNA pseudouridine2605 synthase